jgi:gliding motility-associated-like protein
LNHTLLYCLLFLFLSDYSFGQQNLILNGDFEEYWDCPDDATQIERCKYVLNPLSLSVSTSDYFNTCAIGSTVSAPQTFEGYQLPYSGNGMIGFAPLNNYLDGYNYREYIELSLSKQLLCGNTYHFEGYFNLANLCRFSFKGFEFYFSEEELNNENDYLYNLYTPQVIDTTTPVLDTLNWVKISFDFVADKPYRFISIGNIKSNSSTDYIDFNPLALGQQYYSYYYLDGVSLTQVKESQIEIPNVFTPNKDGINDVFQLIGEVAYFENLLIFNRWGNEVANLSFPFQWNGTTQNGNEALEGVYFYLLNSNEGCKQEQKQGMIHLFR